ncbi:MAG: hypothetical protein LBT55_04590 [Clostridiaceae bacterium]|jgi:uncharacterized ion transporter superfamily protein YfcC|nr:hypothetical protein [Clostridiaceae bacterium]
MTENANDKSTEACPVSAKNDLSAWILDAEEAAVDDGALTPSESGAGTVAKSIQISKKAVIVGVAVILILFFAAYAATFIFEKGMYARDAAGAIIPGTYVEDPSLPGISWWQFLLSPFMILLPSSPGYETVYAIIALLLIIGAIFTALDDTGILVYMVEALNNKFGKKKYILLFVLPFVFMFLGSSAGMFEELIPLVPVVIMLSYALGWDALIGLGITILASCFGFAAGVVNPFTVGVAQTLGGIPLYSGIELRLLTFVIAYIILMAFLFAYARKLDKNPRKSSVYAADLEKKAMFAFRTDTFVKSKEKNRAMLWFGSWMLSIVVLAVISVFVQALAQNLMYITLGVYLVAGIGACFICGTKLKRLCKMLLKGFLTLLPAIAMILFAGGIRYIIEKGDVMDTILYNAVGLMSGQPSFVVTLLIYLIIFIFEMFIPSGSAKAFLLMPMVFNICTLTGIDKQVAVLAFHFADGFANVILPTNAGLLLILGMTTVDYGKWFRWSIKIQLTLLAATIGVLALAQFVVYA